ncbi:MAG: ABC transporter substrate-binding protein [Oscillospiraceae bacterium]|nr:ABC transporter substrate-binding protein [Oscillospiraceae bacterium]
MRRVWPVILALLLLSACSPEWETPPLIVYPSGEPAYGPSRGPVSLPEGPAAGHGFGLAWTPVARLDPFTERDTLNIHLPGLLYEGLFTVDSAFEPRPALCEVMETEDNRRFVLRLREGAVFSDGTPLTAEDVVWSFSQARAAASPYARRLSVVSSVRAHTDGSVSVELHAPRARFAALLDFPIAKKDSAGAAPAGTGPYILRHDGEGYPVLSPNPHHKDAETLTPSRIGLSDARDPADLSFYFQYGHISAMAYDFNDPSRPGIHSGYERYDYPGATLQYIGVSADSGPLAQPLVRRVLSMAVDRETLCRELFDAEAALLPAPPSGALYDASLTGDYAYAPTAALRLLSDAGCADTDADGVLEWPDERRMLPLRFTMAVNAETPARAGAARRLADTLAGIGIELTVAVLPWDEYAAAVSGGAYDLFWAQAALTPDFDPGVFLDPGGALNPGAVPEETAAALDSMRSAPDADAEAAARRELYRLWLEQGRVIAVCFNQKSLLTRRGLFEAPTPASENLFFGFADWGLRP